MIANQLLNDIKHSLSSPRLINELAAEHSKVLTALNWNNDQLELFLAVLPEFKLTNNENGNVSVSLPNTKQSIELALEALLKDAKKPVATDKLIQQLKEFKTSGPQLLAIAKKHPNMNIIGGRAIMYK